MSSLFDRFKGPSWSDRLLRWTGYSVLFLFISFMGAIVAMPPVVLLNLGLQWEWLGFTVAGLFGLGGTILRYRLGGDRFWPVFPKFCVALRCILPGAGIGLVVGMSLFASVQAHDWSIALGAWLPMAGFLMLLAAGKFIPPPPRRNFENQPMR